LELEVGLLVGAVERVVEEVDNILQHIFQLGDIHSNVE
jgi:hypothetical protein